MYTIELINIYEINKCNVDAFTIMNSNDVPEQQFSQKSLTNIRNGASLTRHSAEVASYTSEDYQQSETVVNRTTPVLFSTNRGLYLRVAKFSTPATETGSIISSNATSSRRNYDISFCDLERWSTNRANTVCLEDTIVASRTFTLLPPSSTEQSNSSGRF